MSIYNKILSHFHIKPGSTHLILEMEKVTHRLTSLQELCSCSNRQSQESNLVSLYCSWSFFYKTGCREATEGMGPFSSESSESELKVN